MTIIYIIAGVFAGFLLLIAFGYTLISYLLINQRETSTLDEDQKAKCQEALKAGKARSLACRLYVKKGRCPHVPCPSIENK